MNIDNLVHKQPDYCDNMEMKMDFEYGNEMMSTKVVTCMWNAKRSVWVPHACYICMILIS